MTQSALLSVHDRQPKDGCAGKGGLAKYDGGSTTVAPDAKLARKTDNMGSQNCSGHRKAEKSRRNNSTRLVERKAQKRHTMMNRYDLDPSKERKKLQHKWGGHVAGQTNTEASRALSLHWWRYAQTKHISKWDGV